MGVDGPLLDDAMLSDMITFAYAALRRVTIYSDKINAKISIARLPQHYARQWSTYTRVLL